MKVLLTSADFGIGYELTPVNKRTARQFERATGEESVRIATDWDFPSLAQNLGWNMRKAHKRGCSEPGSTDGTVACRGCGRGASHFIAAAQAWLDKRTDSILRAPVEYYFET